MRDLKKILRRLEELAQDNNEVLRQLNVNDKGIKEEMVESSH